MLEKFINQDICKLCNHPLTFDISPKYQQQLFEANVRKINQNLFFDLNSSFFVNPDEKNFEFHISIINGQICSDHRSDQFAALYNLDIVLSKDCKRCQRGLQPERFYESISIFFDRNLHALSYKPYVDILSFYDNGKLFRIDNERKSTSRLLVYNTKNNELITKEELPFVDIWDFPFVSRDKLVYKIQSMIALK